MTAETQTHRLEMGAAGCCVLKLGFGSSEAITASFELPEGLSRRNRRIVQRWSRGIFRKLDSDPRGLRVVATCNGRLVSIGSEYQGKGIVFFK